MAIPAQVRPAGGHKRRLPAQNNIRKPPLHNGGHAEWAEVEVRHRAAFEAYDARRNDYDVAGAWALAVDKWRAARLADADVTASEAEDGNDRQGENGKWGLTWQSLRLHLKQREVG